MFLNQSDERDEETTMRDDIFRFYGNPGYPTLSRKETTQDATESDYGSSYQSDSSLDTKTTCLSRLKDRKWWNPLMKFIKFLIQFILTNAVLYGAASIFARIEDPEIGPYHEHTEEHLFEFNTTNWTTDSYSDGNSTKFLFYMKHRFSVDINESDFEEFVDSVLVYKNALENFESEVIYDGQLHDRAFIISKWFYFVSIATTTIGYGDVAPKTSNGRLFYIVFSIFGIPLMMSLLAACGEMITLLNTSLFSLVNKYFCEKRRLVSEELLSAISIFLLFIGYISMGCVYVAGLENWSFIDSAYYWIVTFTTVGFGDINQSIETQVKYVAPLVIYRTFGLALLAGCIESILAWLKIRKEALEVEAIKLTEIGKLSMRRKLNEA